MTLAIVGATGIQGRAILEAALQSGEQVSILARPGAEPVVDPERVRITSGFLNQPSAIMEVMRGCECAIFTPPLSFSPEHAVTWVSIMVTSAEHCGVKRFILNSALRPPKRPTGSSIMDSKLAAEIRLREARIETVITRPTLYMGNLLLPKVVERVLTGEKALMFPLREDMVCEWISAEDAAEMVLDIALADRISVPEIELVGCEGITGDELAERLGKGLGRTLRYARLSEDTYAADLRPFIGEDTSSAIGDLYRWLNAHGSETLAPQGGENTAILRAKTTLPEWAAAQEWSTELPEWIVRLPYYQRQQAH